MPRKQHVVRLTHSERQTLERMLRTGHRQAWSLQRARILLATDSASSRPARTDAAVAVHVGCSARTVARARAAWAASGMACLARKERPAPAVAPMLSDAECLEIAALACTDPPVGHARWSLRLLAERVVALEIVPAISHETVRQSLKKTACVLGKPSAS